MTADDGLAPERQRLRKLIRAALKQKPYSEQDLYALILRMSSVRKVNSPKDFQAAVQILVSQKEIFNDGEVFYHPECKPVRPKVRDLDDEWYA